MRLCFIGNPSSVHLERWARFFVLRGHEVHLLATSEPTTPLPGITLHDFTQPRSGRPMLDHAYAAVRLVPGTWRLRRLLRSIRPNLVHAHYVNDAALVAAASGFHPLVITAWGSDILIEPRRSRARAAAARWIMRRADLLTCDAPHLRDAMIRLGAPIERVEIVYFGTDASAFHPALRDDELRAKLGSGPFVISTRSLEPIYSVGTLVEAAAEVVREEPQVTFLIAGSGSEQPRLQADVNRLGFGSRVRFLGRLHPDDLARYLASSDIYVSTALSDGGLAASTAEAMASGLPVIVTDVADNRAWVNDGVQGHLVPPQDSITLAARIVALVRRPERARMLGRAGRVVIVERNEHTRMMRRVEELYEGLVSATGRRTEVEDR